MTLDLHLAALDGNYEWVRNALSSGADVNSLDETGRNALMCAIAGHHWNNLQLSPEKHATSERVSTIQLLLDHPNTNLATLNSPQDAFNGVTPLGMASWLNIPSVVSLLLERSLGTVSVDAMDTHGATALMYAARDANLQVVKTLLHFGARPNFRDQNHWSSVQYSLSHPQVLYLCESSLRRHRLHETRLKSRLSPSFTELQTYLSFSLPPCFNLPQFTPKTTSRITDTLVKTIVKPDVGFLRSLLFSFYLSESSLPNEPMALPILINKPDAKGWSPLHYCVSVPQPSIDVLDMLYCSGADMGLFTKKERYTPLHCLARYHRTLSSSSTSPTSAKGRSLELYEFILHLVQDLHSPLDAKDLNDETCLHIAAEHGSRIEVLVALLDCDISGKVRKMKNKRGKTPFEVAKEEFKVVFDEEGTGKCRLRPSESNSSLGISPTSVDSDSDSSYLDLKQTTLSLISQLSSPSRSASSSLSESLLAHLHQTTLSLSVSLSSLLKTHTQILATVSTLENVSDEKVREGRLARVSRGRAGSTSTNATGITNATGMTGTTTGIRWSQSSDLFEASPTSSQLEEEEKDKPPALSHSSVSVQTDSPSNPASPLPNSNQAYLSVPTQRGISKKRSGQLMLWFDNLIHPSSSSLLSPTSTDSAPPTPTLSIQTDLTSPKKDNKLKIWFKSKLYPSSSSTMSTSPPVSPLTATIKYTLVLELEDPLTSPIGREPKLSLLFPSSTVSSSSSPLLTTGMGVDSIENSILYTLRTSSYIFECVKRDMESIEKMMDKLREMNESVEEGVGSVERLLVKLSNSMTNGASTSTSASADMQLLKTLVFSKIDPMTHKLLSEIERVQMWMRVCKEVVGDVRRRAYL